MKAWAELIQDVVEAKRTATKRLYDVRKAQDSILADAALAEQVAAGASLRLYVDSWTATLSAAVELSVVDLKTDTLLLATLERALAVAEATKSHDIANEWQAERVFCFTLPGGGDLRVEANIKADGTTCRKVQVGVTTRVEPTYELRCD